MCSRRDLDLRAKSSNWPVELDEASKAHRLLLKINVAIKLHFKTKTRNGERERKKKKTAAPLLGDRSGFATLDRNGHLLDPITAFRLVRPPLMCMTSAHAHSAPARTVETTGRIGHGPRNVQQTDRFRLPTKAEKKNANVIC